VSKNNIILIILFAIILCNCDRISVKNTPVAAINCNDSTFQVGNYCVFDASNSCVGSGDTLIYNWEQDDSNPIPINIFELMHDKKSSIGFCVEGTYKFRLTVNNGIQDSEAEEIEITVLPREIARFEDPTLEVQIRYILNIPTGILPDSSLLTIDSLRRLIFTGEDISSLDGIEQCPNIEYLWMNHQNITDITPLSTLYELKMLQLVQTWEIDDISALTNLTNLEYLDIQCNEVRDLSPLAGLTKLKYLNILENPVEDCSHLSHLIHLEELFLGQTPIIDLSFVNQMDSLYLLWAPASNISNLSPISDRTNLKSIHFGWNQIQDISALQNMSEIEECYIPKNLIENIEPLVNNNGLGEGDLLVIYGNPLDSISVNQYIPILRSRGVIIRN